MIPTQMIDLSMFPTVEERFTSKFRKAEGCWLWAAAKNTDGYGVLMLRNKAAGIPRKLIRAHQLSYLLYRGDIPQGRCVCHSCDRPSCVNPSHLFLATQAENILDCKAKGRTRNGMKDLVGERHPGAVLNAAIVRRAREASKVRGGLVRLSAESGFKYGTLWAAAKEPWGGSDHHR